MAATGPKKQFALDANLLFDLAADHDFAHTFRDVFQEKGYVLKVPPTVVQEISFAAFRKTGEEQRLAIQSLRCMRDWGLVAYDLKSVGHGITEQFAQRLMSKGIVPEGEFNDGLIVAETALAEIPVLITSDQDLLSADTTLLLACLSDFDLPAVQIAHPRRMLAAVR